MKPANLYSAISEFCQHRRRNMVPIRIDNQSHLDSAASCHPQMCKNRMRDVVRSQFKTGVIDSPLSRVDQLEACVQRDRVVVEYAQRVGRRCLHERSCANQQREQTPQQIADCRLGASIHGIEARRATDALVERRSHHRMEMPCRKVSIIIGRFCRSIRTESENSTRFALEAHSAQSNAEESSQSHE